MRKVGILGGMGPEATVLLMQKLLAMVQAQDDADHIPLLVDQNPQVPSRIGYLLEGSCADPAPVLMAMARGLQAAGAEALAMPCNTAHHFAPQIRAATALPLLDMVEAAMDHALALAGPGGRIGILASPAVRRTGLFSAPLAARGLFALHPADETCILNMIRLIKSKGPVPQAQAALTEAAKELVARQADVLMIACTEFSLMPQAVRSAAGPVPVFDTLDVLVRAIASFAQNAAKASPDQPGPKT